MTESTFACEPIGFIKTPFREKFGIPRQPALAPNIQGRVVFTPSFNHPDFLRGIEQFSHLWLLFNFHQHQRHQPSALIRPPRLGGNTKIGVFASRSSFRPNGIGMSLVSYHSHQFEQGQLSLTVGGIDLVNDTPILDIKPYVAYSDAQDNAKCGYATPTPQTKLHVEFSPSAQQQLQQRQSQYPSLAEDIETLLSLDPRPAYKQASKDTKEYSIWLYDVDIKWQVQQNTVIVLDLVERL